MSKTVGRTKEQDFAVGSLLVSPTMIGEMRESGLFLVEAWRGLRLRRPKPQLLWKDVASNTVVDQGLNHKRSVIFLGGTQITAWFVMPVDGTPTIATGDTYASHAGWVEQDNYDEATREAWTGATTGTAGEVSNAASRAEFTISAGGETVGGCAMVGGGGAASTKNDTAGGGTLMSVAAFSGGDRVLQEADVLRVTYIQRSARP